MFLRNVWYVAALSSEVSRSLLPRRLLGEMVVMYRTEAEKLVALEDRCPHRNLPLSKGALVGPDRVQCGYHGIEFDPAGTCVFDPETKRPLPWADVRSFPVAERYGWIFIWMGDPALADESKIPDFHKRMFSGGYDTFGGRGIAKCGYRMTIDNLYTLSHLGYVHKGAGAVDFAERPERTVTPIQDASLGEGIRLKHVVRNLPAPPAYTNCSGSIDRWHLVDYFPPAYFCIRYNSVPATDGEFVFDEGDSWDVYHAVTPETETTSHDFWAHVSPRGIFIGKDAAEFERQIRQVIDEDMEIYEAMQDCVLKDLNAKSTDVQAKGARVEDTAFLMARKLLERRIREENNQSLAVE